MMYKSMKMVAAVGAALAMAACGTIDPAKVAKIDKSGQGVFLGKAFVRSDLDKKIVCSNFNDERCNDPGQEVLGVVFANSYWNGMAKVGAFVPKSANVHAGVTDGDIVKIKIVGSKAYWVETVAKHGDPSCYWSGGTSLTEGGVVCPRLGYSYKNLADYSASDFWK